MKTRTDLINFIIKHKNAKKYLEIGIQNGINFEDIKVEHKIGVDPYPTDYCLENSSVLKMTSDMFFRLDDEKYQMFDVIFIDGLHTEKQTWIDLQNSLRRLNKGGVIILHDALPKSLKFTALEWNGSTYKAIMRAAQTSGIKLKTWEHDHGCAIVVKDENNINETQNVITRFSHLWKNNGEIVGKSTTEQIIKYIGTL